MGIAAAGSATGGLVYPVVVQQLLPKIGFGWTVRVLGFITLATSTFTALALRTRLPPRKSGPLVEWDAFREPTYVLYVSGMFLNFWALYFAFYYVGAFGRNIIGISYSDSISILLIMNGIGMIGRLVPAFLADKYFGPLNMIAPCAFFAGILFFSWPGVHSWNGLIAFACVYGLFSAGVQALWPAGLASLTTDLKKAGTRMGMGFTLVSFACLTGPPLAGALITEDGGGYLKAQMWAGTCMVVGGITLFVARIASTGFVLRKRI